MKTPETPKEVQLQYIADDFEEGDRIYYITNGVTKKGTVRYGRTPRKEDHIPVSLDISGHLMIPLYKFSGKSKAVKFYRGKKDDYCGRIPKLRNIEKGTVLSRLQNDGTRQYAIVMLHEPGKRLLINRPEQWEVFDYLTSRGSIFEDQLFDWEIEG